MIELTFVLTPLLVLLIVLLFRFVGCTSFGVEETATEMEPLNYRKYILGESNNPELVKNRNVVPIGADVIGYWRLVDTDNTVAIDENHFKDGKYRTSNDPDTVPGNFGTGQSSLIKSDPKVLGRYFNGGFVVVPTDGKLYTDKFTIEAWVLAGFTDKSEHTLFHAGGHYRKPFDSTADNHGFRIFATGFPPSWQVSLQNGQGVFPAPPLIPQGNEPTHLAVTVLPASTAANTTVTIFIDGKQTVQQTVGFYSRPDGAPLLIGVMGEQSEPSDLETLAQPNVKQPMRSRIQEVVLHRKALSQEEIENHFYIGSKEALP
ncbi:MAG: LamG-like jellyroll fold domain-containing protein [Desulfobacterales bacterium]